METNVLIVQSSEPLAAIWARHLRRLSCKVWTADDADTAIDLIQNNEFRVIVLDLVLRKGSALAVSDLASYRCPDAKVIFVTNTSFFSDGSIFQLCNNACAFLPCATEPQDLACMVDHYARLNDLHSDEERQSA